MSEQELKPCPFCGGECDATGWLRGDGVRGPECAECGATAASVEEWNRRAQRAEAEGVGVVAEAYSHRSRDSMRVTVMNIRQIGRLRDGDKLVRQVDHLAALSAVTAERDRLRDQVKVLQSDANSWQSGYDKGRRDGTKHRQSEVDQLRAEVEALRNEAASEPNIYRAVVHALRRAADGQRFGAAKVQRTFLLGYNSAVRLIEEMARRGDIVPDEGAGEEGWAYKFPDAAMAAKDGA